MYAQTTLLEREMARLEKTVKQLDQATAKKFAETKYMFDKVVSGTKALIFRGKTAETLERERVQKAHDDSIKRLEELLAEAKALIR